MVHPEVVCASDGKKYENPKPRERRRSEWSHTNVLVVPVCAHTDCGTKLRFQFEARLPKNFPYDIAPAEATYTFESKLARQAVQAQNIVVSP